MSTGMLEGQGNGPTVEDQDKLVVGADAAPVASPQPSDDRDVDDLMLEQLRAAADAEEPGQGAGGTEGQAQADTNAGTPPAQQDQDAQGQPQGKPKAVPIERFQQVYRTAKDLEAENARLVGENLALKSRTQPAGPTVDPRSSELDQQIVALAQKFDDGLITAAEWKQQERSLQAQIDQIKEDAIAARVAQRSQPPAPAADLTFNRESQRIESAYEPFMELIPDAYLDSFVATVRAELAAEGIRQIRPNSEELLLFRERCGQKAEAEADMWSRMSNKPVPRKGQPQQTQQRAPAGNQPTPEQRMKKLQMQTEMAPNLGQLNRTGGVEDAPSDLAIESMSDEEIAALTPAIKNRLLGITP